MHYPALSEQQLSRFTYHWFWGLGVDQTEGMKTLYQEAVDIRADETERERLLGQVKWVSQLPWLLLALYWLLNIGNYRVNCYRLHSYISLAIYEEELITFIEADQEKIKSLGGFVAQDLSAGLLGHTLSWPLIPVNKKHPELLTGKKSFLVIQSESFSKSLTPFLPIEMRSHVLKFPYQRPKLDIESNYSSGVNSSSYALIQTTQHRGEWQARLDADVFETPQVIVTHEMLEPLRVLGLSRGMREQLTLGMGEQFTLKELKLAYKKSALRTHPDKTRSENTDAFNAVTKAFDKIIELIRLSKTSNSCLTPKFAYHLDVFNKSAQEELDGWRELRKDIKLAMNQVKEMDETIADVLADFRWMNEVQAQLNTEAGLPPITDEDIEGCLKDPDYFNKKYAAMGEDSREDSTSVVPVSIFISSDGNNTSTSSTAAHVEHLTENRL